MLHGINVSSSYAVQYKKKSAAVSAHRMKFATCAPCSTKCVCSKIHTNWTSCAALPPFPHRHIVAPCNSPAPINSSIRSKRNCCMNSAVMARAMTAEFMQQFRFDLILELIGAGELHGATMCLCGNGGSAAHDVQFVCIFEQTHFVEQGAHRSEE